jgi:hypothetical protein
MKIKGILLITGMWICQNVFAQATGNVIWNSNNRFMQNSNYRQTSSGKKYMSAQPTVTYDAYGQPIVSQSIAGAYTFSNFIAGTQEVVMNINVLYNAKPSGYMAIFHLNQTGKKIHELDTQVSRKVNKFKILAKTLGILEEDFYMDMIALVPIFEQNKRNSTKPKGFELQKNLHVKYSHASDLDKLFSFAAQCEIYDLIKVEYLYDNAEKAGKDMRSKALGLLQDKINFYKSLGVKVDSAYRSISESGDVFFPVDKYKDYAPLSVSSLDDEDVPGEDKGELMKTSYGMIQRRTVFYNPTDLSGYDAVINPDPVEPPIQFTYTLQVRYKMQQPVKVVDNSKTEKTTELLIVTQDGQIREIKK